MKNKTSTVLTHWLDFRFKLFLEGILIGLITGVVIVLYRILLEDAEELRISLYSFVSHGSWLPILLLFAGLALIGYFLGMIVKYEPMVSGSGIPQVKGVLLSQVKMNWLRIITAKFFGGILAIGAGLSLGREGPSVQIGAAAGQGVSRLLGRLRIEEKYLITSGASAGLAAAFNAPLAGVIFALEEMHKSFSPIVLTSAMAASLTADFLSRHFFGQKPIFTFDALSTLPLNYYPFLIVLGLIIGVFGVLFNSGLVASLNLYKKMRIPKEFRPVIPLLAAGFLGFLLPEVLGGGHKLIDTLGARDIALSTLIVLVIVKFLFTMLSYGSGAPGGIFLPLLVIGALTGNIFGDILHQFVNIDATYIKNFIVLAMAAYFTAIVRAPITGSILITEMTGSFSHLLSMATVSMTAYLVADILKSKPVYEVLLERILRKNGSENWGDAHNKVIMEMPVCLGSKLDNKRIMDINWPKDCLLVGIKRGETEIIPKGNTLIRMGDYLIILTNEDKEPLAKEAIGTLAGECPT